MQCRLISQEAALSGASVFRTRLGSATGLGSRGCGLIWALEVTGPSYTLLVEFAAGLS
jgi:hypothetical protein